GFYNTVGFNDDTRAFLSIPARHDVARRIDCRYLAQLVCEHRLAEDDAREVALDLAYRLPKRAYRLQRLADATTPHGVEEDVQVASGGQEIRQLQADVVGDHALQCGERTAGDRHDEQA